MASRRAASLTPASRATPSIGELEREYETLLRERFLIEPLGSFGVIVEGTTDVGYLHHVAEMVLSESGEDLLAVPEHLAERGRRILIQTAGTPGSDGPRRGGIPQMVRLAEELRPYVFTLSFARGVVFLFDHDDAGLRAAQEVMSQGYRQDQHVLTLDPVSHPRACGAKQIVIEDLLSLGLQHRFFQRGEAWCSAIYEDGRLVRFHWGHQSKSKLHEFARQEGERADFREIEVLLRRFRGAFGLP